MLRALLESLRLAALRLVRHRFQFSCLVCFTSAVILPILLIAGLRHGILDNMRAQLLSDPRITEVTITGSSRISIELIEQIKQWPEIGFLLPKTRLLGAPVALSRLGEREDFFSYDLFASAAGDPLLERSSISSPEQGEIVLSYDCAQALHLRAGDQVELTASRNHGKEKLHLPTRIAAILPEGASKSRIFAPLQLCEQVEEFLESRHSTLTPQLRIPREQPLYQSILLLKRGSVPQDALEQLAQLWSHDKRIRLYDSRAADLAEELKQCALLPQPVLILHAEAPIFSLEALSGYKHQFEQLGYMSYLWNPPLEVGLSTGKGSKRVLVTTPPLHPDSNSSKLARTAQLQSSLPAASDVRLDIASSSLVNKGQSIIIAQLEHAPNTAQDTFTAPPALRALLNWAQKRSLIWDYRQRDGIFALRQDYASMRLYAKHPQYCQALAARLRDLGISCEIDVYAYHEVEQLDSQLGELFWLVAIITLVGAFTALSLSLFNTTENRRKSYAILLSLGMHQTAVALIPLWESLCTILASTLVSFLLFTIMSHIIESFFVVEQSHAGALCRLEYSHWLYLVIISCLAASLAALFSCIRILRISTPETLKES